VGKKFSALPVYTRKTLSHRNLDCYFCYTTGISTPAHLLLHVTLGRFCSGWLRPGSTSAPVLLTQLTVAEPRPVLLQIVNFSRGARNKARCGSIDVHASRPASPMQWSAPPPASRCLALVMSKR